MHRAAPIALGPDGLPNSGWAGTLGESYFALLGVWDHMDSGGYMPTEFGDSNLTCPPKPAAASFA